MATNGHAARNGHASNSASIQMEDVTVEEKGDGNKPTQVTPLMAPESPTERTPAEDGQRHHFADGLDWGYHPYRKEESSDEDSSNEEDDEMDIKDVGVAFRDRSSLVGFTQINESVGVIKKVFWFVVMLVGLGMLIFHTTSLVLRYVKFDTAVNLYIQPERPIQFPAVTVCNNNMLTRSGSSSVTSPRLVNRYADFFATDKHQTRGHQLEDLIVNATFNDHQLSASDFKYIGSAVFGNCYMFNYEGNHEIRRMLPGYGLRMILNIESYKYNKDQDYMIPEFIGAIVSVHRPNVEPIVEERLIMLSPSTSNRIGVKRSVYRRLDDSRYGVCGGDDFRPSAYYYSGSYNKENCENSCLQKAVLDRCCCYIKTMKRNLTEYPETYNKTCAGVHELEELLLTNGTSCGVCKVGKRNHLGPCDESSECYQQVWDNYNLGVIRCDDCPEECKEEVYEVSTNVVAWPSHDYMEDWLLPALWNNQSEKNRNLLEDLEDFTDFENVTEEMVRANYLSVEVNYESMTTTYIDVVPLVGDAEFVAELESLAGFWMCWSMWTLFQFVEFISDLIAISIQKCKNMLTRGQTNQQPAAAAAATAAATTGV